MPVKTKIEALLGFSVRARKILLGADYILECRKRLKLIFYDPDLSENTRKKLANFAQERKIPIFSSPSPLAELLYKPGVKAAALTDPNMATEIVKEMQLIAENKMQNTGQKN